MLKDPRYSSPHLKCKISKDLKPYTASGSVDRQADVGEKQTKRFCQQKQQVWTPQTQRKSPKISSHPGRTVKENSLHMLISFSASYGNHARLKPPRAWGTSSKITRRIHSKVPDLLLRAQAENLRSSDRRKSCGIFLLWNCFLILLKRQNW